MRQEFKLTLRHDLLFVIFSSLTHLHARISMGLVRSNL